MEDLFRELGGADGASGASVKVTPRVEGASDLAALAWERRREEREVEDCTAARAGEGLGDRVASLRCFLQKGVPLWAPFISPKQDTTLHFRESMYS